MTPPQKWRILSFDENTISSIQTKYSLSRHFSKVLAERHITTDEGIRNILFPSLKSLHSPNLLPDVEAGCERIQQAIKQGEHILIWGDEDTDGITATVFLYELLSNLNGNVHYHIPNRRTEGIGLNAMGIQRACDNGISLIITADCASSDTELIVQARSKRVDVVVTDHHETPEMPQNHHPLINPKRKDASYPWRDIAGVAVAFKLGWRLAHTMLSLTDREWQSISSEWIPLVFLGTYGDKVPLQDENWTLAHLGFRALMKTKRKGLRMLRETLCKEGPCDETMVQKMIGVFSAGKTDGWGQNMSFKVLTETGEPFLRETIPWLIETSNVWYARANGNLKRALAETEREPHNDIISIYVPGVESEFLGFCASRLRERYGRSVVAIAEKGDLLVGEARAPRGVDIHRILSRKRSLFSSFGGHQPACGFTLEKARLSELRSFLSGDFPGMAKQGNPAEEVRIIDELPLGNLSVKVRRELVSLAPFGAQNPPPLFLAKKVSLSKGVYSHTVPETGETKMIELKNNAQSWAGINGKPIMLDIVYYLNGAGALTIADARPSLFNESHAEHG